MSPLNIPGLETERPYEYVAAFLSKQEADAYFEKIMAELRPKMGPADTYGRMKGSTLDCSSTYLGYRESLWIGPAINPGKSEARRCSHGPEQREWPAVLKDIKERVESATGQHFNSCLVNLYPHGKSGIAQHRDQDDESDWTHPIASVSLGADRLFNIYDNFGVLLSSEILEHGSLCVMPAGFQETHLHELEKQPGVKEPRINLTFRWIADWQKKSTPAKQTKQPKYQPHSDAYKPPYTTIGEYNGRQATSALQKCIRRGLEKDALFWATELWDSCNKDGREYIWHRLRVIASEDIGLADNNACVQVSALYANFQRRPNMAEIFLWHAVLLLARAPKSRIVDHAGIAVTKGPRPKREMPAFAIDNHAGGKMNWDESFKLENCTLPDEYEAEARAICEAAKDEA